MFFIELKGGKSFLTKVEIDLNAKGIKLPKDKTYRYQELLNPIGQIAIRITRLDDPINILQFEDNYYIHQDGILSISKVVETDKLKKSISTADAIVSGISLPK